MFKVPRKILDEIGITTAAHATTKGKKSSRLGKRQSSIIDCKVNGGIPMAEYQSQSPQQKGNRSRSRS